MKSERRHPSYGVLRISRMHGTAGRRQLARGFFDLESALIHFRDHASQVGVKFAANLLGFGFDLWWWFDERAVEGPYRTRHARILVERRDCFGKLRRKIRIALDAIVAQVRQNVPFILQQFEEATSKVVTAAKSEIEAFATMRLLAAGIEVTAAGAPQITERAEVTEAANPGLK